MGVVVVEPVLAEKLGAITTRGTLVREPWSGNQPSLVWEGLFAVLRSPFPGGPRGPMFSLVVRAAAANVNPRTRLSHVTEIPPLLGSSLVHARTMPSHDAKFPKFPPRILRRAREFTGFSERRPGLEHTTPHTTEAWCVPY